MIDIERVIRTANFLIKQDFAQNLTEIAVRCGKSKQYFSDLKRKKSYPSMKFIDDFCSNYPINKDYILTGNGEILLSPGNATAQTKEVNAPGGVVQNIANNGNGNVEANTNTAPSNESTFSEVLQKLVETNAELVKTNAALVAALTKQHPTEQ